MAAGIKRALAAEATATHRRGQPVHRCVAILTHHYRELVRDDNQES